jgi:DNA-binding response OmpR family regulator
VAAEPAKTHDVIQFGPDIELDLRAYQLRRGGRSLKLERQPMDILIFLIEHQGELVTREQIADHIWGQTAYLDFDNSINGAIRKIRQVLNDDPENPLFVQAASDGAGIVARCSTSTADKREITSGRSL